MKRFTNKDAAAERERKNAAEKVHLGGREVRMSALLKSLSEVGLPVDVGGGKVVTWRVTEEDLRLQTKLHAELKHALLAHLPLTKKMRNCAAVTLNWMIPITDHERDAEWRDAMLLLCQMWEQGTKGCGT